MFDVSESIEIKSTGIHTNLAHRHCTSVHKTDPLQRLEALLNALVFVTIMIANSLPTFRSRNLPVTSNVNW